MSRKTNLNPIGTLNRAPDRAPDRDPDCAPDRSSSHGRGVGLRAALLWPMVLVLLCAVVAMPSARGQLKELPPFEWSRTDTRQMERMARRIDTDGQTWELNTGNWIVRSDVSARFTVELAYYLELFGRDVIRYAEFTGLNTSIVPTIEVYADQQRLGHRLRSEQGVTRGRFEFDWDSSDEGEQSGDFERAMLLMSVGDPDNRDFSVFLASPEALTLKREVARALLQLYVGPSPIAGWFSGALGGYYRYWDTRLEERENHQRIVYLIYTTPYWRQTFEAETMPPLSFALERDGASAGDLLPTLYDTMRTNNQARGIYSALINRFQKDQVGELVGSEEEKLQSAWHERIGEVYQALQRMGP